MSIKTKRGKKLKVRTIREVLQLHWGGKASQNKISDALRVSKGSVNNTIKRGTEAELSLEDLSNLDDKDLERRIYPVVSTQRFGEPDFAELFDELSKPAVTAQLLFEEYQDKNPEGMKRSTFYKRLREQKNAIGFKPTMQQTYKGGDYLQVDYSGLKTHYTDPKTNKEIEVEIFVASWAASSYIYAEATPSQKQEDWIASNVRALRFFNKSPAYLVPDNLKSGVVKANFYDPDINLAYDEMARHYGCVVLPARSRKPRDKAGVESNVRFVQNYILGRLRKRKFYSLNDLNLAIQELLIELNNRPMQRFKMSRKERFDKIDIPYAKDLPVDDFTILEIKHGVQVNKNHHVNFRGHYYSAPWRLTKARVDIWYTGKMVEIYFDNERVALHLYSDVQGECTTQEGHRPPEHAFIRKLNPVWVLSKSLEIGPKTHSHILSAINKNPSQCENIIRKALGIIELSKAYSPQRVERAIEIAMEFSKIKLIDIKAVLEQSLDLEPIEQESNKVISLQYHMNLRGAEFYTQHREENTCK